MDGALNTSCTFVQNTTAIGYLAIVSEVSCNSDLIFLVEYNTAGTHDTTNGIGSGDYRIAFFDIENDGLPSHSSDANYLLIGSASLTKVTIPRGTRDQNYLGV